MPDAAGATVVEVDVADEPPAQGARLVGERLLAAIGHGAGFVAVVRMPSAPPRGVRLGDVTERVRLLKRLRPGLAQHCLGLAFVVTPETMQRQAKAIRSGDRIWGCPTLTTTDAGAAREWALRQAAANS